jgi:hypothetical protein
VLGLGVYAVAQRFRPAPAVEEERA